MKFNTKLSHFSWTEVNEMNPRGILCSKTLFPTHHPNWGSIEQKFEDILAELDYILQNLATNYGLF
jgi:hypothetical protein